MQTSNPLLGKFDKDPGRWRPYKYGVDIDVPILVNGSAQGTVQIYNQPLVLIQITHSIVGQTEDPQASGLYQDGQYYIEWRDEQAQYQSGPILARAGYGTEEFPIPLPQPIGYAGNRTLTFTVTNAYTRALTPPADTFRVHIVLHGIADWGTDKR